MPSQSDYIRHSQLFNRSVLGQKTRKELGRVERVWMHPAVHRVLGVIVQSGSLGNRKFAFNLSQIETLDATNIVVNSRPVETNAEAVGVLETLIGSELWSDAGDKIGKIVDCIFDLETGVITQYLFRSEGWRGSTKGICRLPPHQILDFGKTRVLVSEAVMGSFTADQDGIEQKLSKAGDRLKESYTEVTQELRTLGAKLSLSEQAQDMTTQTQKQVQQLTQKVGQQLETFTQQATKTAKSITEYLEDPPLNPAQDLQQRGVSLLAHLQEKVSSLGEEVKEDILPFAHQVKAKLHPSAKPSFRPSAQEIEINLDTVPPEDLEDDAPWI